MTVQRADWQASLRRASRVGSASPLRFALASFVAACGTLGCTSSRPPQELSRAIEVEYQVRCPAEELQVADKRWDGSDEIYTLNACGRSVELVYGLELPRTVQELQRYSIRDLPRIEPNLKPYLPKHITELVRGKVAEWCALKGQPAEFADQIRFANDTQAQVEACQKRLSDAVVPLGTDLVPGRSDRRYWFLFNKWVFAVRPTYHLPTAKQRRGSTPAGANELESASTGTAAGEPSPSEDSADRESIAVEPRPNLPKLPSEREAERRTEKGSLLHRDGAFYHQDGAYLRLVGGVGGFWAYGDKIDDRSASNFELGFRAGVSVESRLVIGLDLTLQYPISENRKPNCPSFYTDCVVNPTLNSLRGFVLYYPIQDIGLHVDGLAGAGWLTDMAFEDELSKGFRGDTTLRGLLVGASVGYDLWALRTLGVGIGVRADYLPFAEMSAHAASLGAFAGLTYY